MNSYEQKQEARKEYYQAKAEQARQEAERQGDIADSISSYIPPGQPILVGHHSEKRHRKDIERINSAHAKRREEAKKAEYYEQKAQSVGKAGISSDDPEAVKKLTDKLHKLEDRREHLKSIRKIMRDKDEAKARQGLKVFGLHDAAIDALYTPDFAGRIGIPEYELSNLAANIRIVKLRIEKLKAQDQRETKELTIGEIKVIQNVQANRLQIFFPGKPDQATRDKLKSGGFRWTPSLDCWQAYLNNRALYKLNKILET